jgi:hypothetical protein
MIVLLRVPIARIDPRMSVVEVAVVLGPLVRRCLDSRRGGGFDLSGGGTEIKVPVGFSGLSHDLSGPPVSEIEMNKELR